MHAGPSNPPAPDRFLDRGIDDLAHAIGALAHALPLLDPVEDRPHVAAIDAAVHVVDVAFHFTDVAAPGAGGHPNLVPAVQSLVRAVGEIVPCIAPAPERGIVLALDTLAHTLDFAAHEGIPPEPERPLLGALDTLVHAIDALVGPSPIETVPGGALHPAGTLDLLLH